MLPLAGKALWVISYNDEIQRTGVDQREGLLLEPQSWPNSKSEAYTRPDSTEAHKNKVGRNIQASEKQCES